MNNSLFLPLILPFGIIFGLMLIMYEDGVPFSVLNKIRCRFGNHRFKTMFRRTNKYYCQNCKKPRNHPVLKLVAGGNMGDNDPKF